MKKDFLETLHCPFCNSNFKVDYCDKEDYINWGIVSCTCSRFPVVEGIFVLKNNDLLKNVVELIEKQRFNDAFYNTFLIDKKFFKDFFENPNKQNKIFDLYRGQNVSFEEVVDSLKVGDFGNYLKYRFACKSFFETLPPITVMKGETILDFGCGTGHFAFLLNILNFDSEITASDQIFSYLYLAKKFFVENANLICIEPDTKLPFSDKYFSLVFNSDSFHYIDSKETLADEFERILSDKGTILLTHLHNKLVFNHFSGKPLEPKSYKDLFKKTACQLFSNEDILKNYFEKEIVDFSSESKNIDSSQTLTLVSSNNSEVFRKHEDLSNKIVDLVSKENLFFNLIYEVTSDKDNFLLQKKYPSQTYEEEHRINSDYFPDRYNLNRKEISDNNLYDLIRRFVLFDFKPNISLKKYGSKND